VHFLPGTFVRACSNIEGIQTASTSQREPLDVFYVGHTRRSLHLAIYPIQESTDALRSKPVGHETIRFKFFSQSAFLSALPPALLQSKRVCCTLKAFKDGTKESIPLVLCTIIPQSPLNALFPLPRLYGCIIVLPLMTPLCHSPCFDKASMGLPNDAGI
jgi:hypothetical protein